MIKTLERLVGQKILSVEGHKFTTGRGAYFFKSSPSATSSFREEVLGLRALSEFVTVPAVHIADDHFLVLEWVESEAPTPEFWPKLARALAKLHQTKWEEFGFETNNHLGPTPQTNPRRSHREISWGEYFFEYRLKPLLGHRSLAVDPLLQAGVRRAGTKMRELLANVVERPSLVHGDFWGGNFLCGQGEPVFIDPAPYYGHREVDLAMSELFGGFEPKFYETYQALAPLAPGYEERRPVYNLYHLLNHWIIFGAASYRERTLSTLGQVGS